MIAQHALLYLASRLFAAAANLGAVAVFTRLAASDVYGGYLLIFSWAFVVYGFLAQWLGSAFFATYRQDNAGPQIAILGWLSAGSIVVAAAVIAFLVVSGSMASGTACALFLAVVSLVLFVTVIEAERTMLEARTVAIAVMLRAVLIVSCGSAALLAGGSAVSLTCAVAAASIVAGLPSLMRLAPHLVGPCDPAALRRFIEYGWPLVIAFGITALGQNVDRLILAHVNGTAQLGPYGATSDFLKQSFGVLSEAIALAVVSIAKNAAMRGDHAAARRSLLETFQALTVTVSFVAVFIVAFADEIVAAIFGPEFRETARTLVPWLLAVNAVLIFRSFYFGQSIYFGQSSRNEMIASAAMLIVTGIMSLVLIPRFAMVGAAVAATGGHLAGCAVYVVARPRMPIPLASFCRIVAIAAVVLASEIAVSHAGVPAGWPMLALKLLIFAVSGLVIVWRFDVLGLTTLARGVLGNRLAANPAE